MDQSLIDSLRQVHLDLAEAASGDEPPSILIAGDAFAPVPPSAEPQLVNQLPMLAMKAEISVAASAGPTPLQIETNAQSGEASKAKIVQLPTQGSVVKGSGEAVALNEELTIEELSSLSYKPNASPPGDAGSLVVLVFDAEGGVAAGITRIILFESNTPLCLSQKSLTGESCRSISRRRSILMVTQ